MQKNNFVSTALVSAIVALLVMGAGLTVLNGATPQGDEALGSEVKNTPDIYSEGVGIGKEYVFIAKSGNIALGSNEGYWLNNTGRTVIVDGAHIGFDSGTATSSMEIYAGIATSASFDNDFARPTLTQALIDGALFATSTQSFIAQATTTDNGVGAVQVADGEYIVFQVQEQFGCVADGACTTATSTDRGITLDWFLTGHYKP